MLGKTIGLKTIGLLLGAVTTAAAAATYEDGLRLKQEQKLEAAASAFADALQAQPDDVRALEQLAIVQGWLQRFDDSIATWRQTLALQPQRVDAHIGLGRVLYWKGERASALTALDQALAIEPANVEALTLKGDVLLAQNDAAGARRAYTAAQAVSGAGGDPALAQKIARARPPQAWRLDAGGAFDDYSRTRGDEGSAYLQLGHRFSPQLSAYANFTHYDNFGTTDEALTVGAYVLVLDRLQLNPEVGTNLDDENFRPQSLAGLNAELLLDAPVQPLLGVRYLRYGNGNVTTVTPGLRLLRDAAQLELRYGLTNNVDGSDTDVFSARASYSAGRYAPYLAYARGDEALPPQALARIRIYGAGCVLDLSRAWGVRADYSFEDRVDIYRHHTFGLGLTYRY